MKKELAIFTLFILSSCITIEMSGRTNDYDKLNEEQKSLIRPFAEASNLEIGKVYKLNGKDLLSELENHPKSLVYVFTNGCTGELCLPLGIYEDYAKKNNRKLFLVMNGFGNIAKTIDQPIESPLFVIDGDYYQEKFREDYSQKFTNELKGVPIDTKRKEVLADGALYFFSKSQLDTVCKTLPKTEFVGPQF